MKKKLLISIFLIFSACSNYKSALIDKKENSLVREKIILINKIIAHPEEAIMSNWLKLSNPHDESEIAAYADFIGDGTVQSAEETLDLVVKHSKNLNAPSVILQLLRSNVFLAMNHPSMIPPFFEVSQLKKENRDGFEYIMIEASLVIKYEEKSIRIPAKISFYHDKEEEGAKLQLSKILLKNQIIYGWWYGFLNK